MAALDLLPGRLVATAGPLSGAFAPEAAQLFPSRLEGGREGEPSTFARLLEEKQNRLEPVEARAPGAPGPRTLAAEAPGGDGRERPAEGSERSAGSARDEHASAEGGRTETLAKDASAKEAPPRESSAKEPPAKDASAADRPGRREQRPAAERDVASGAQRAGEGQAQAEAARIGATRRGAVEATSSAAPAAAKAGAEAAGTRARPARPPSPASEASEASVRAGLAAAAAGLGAASGLLVLGRAPRSPQAVSSDTPARPSAPRAVAAARPRVVVIDLRGGEPQGQAAAVGREGREVRQPNADGKDFGSLLRGAGGNAAADKAAGSGEALRGLPERVLPEIVRQTGIILKEGNSGEIRLVLRPEHLGSVRVRLTLGESSVEGRIVVENYSVKELLDAGLDGLKQALRQEGFQTASLDVSVADRHSGQDAAFGPPEAGPVRRVSEQFDRAVPVVLDLGSGLVNVYA